MHSVDVLSLLVDGERHSGEALARSLGVTRAAVWKQMGKLEEWGLEIDSAPGSGYQLSRPIDLLSKNTILAELDVRVAERLERLQVVPILESTNQALLEDPAPGPGNFTACLAEFQSAGRGRRGRQWSAPFGGGLCLSVAWQFDEIPPDLSALALAVGVVVRRAIGSLTGRSVELKWPNDLVWEDRKLGGILVELSAQCQGPCHVVVGVGVNVSMSEKRLREIADWPAGAADLFHLTEGSPPSRNVLAGRLLEGLFDLMRGYGSKGFSDHHAAFEAANYLQGRYVAVDDGSSIVSGKAVAVDPDGALVIETALGVHRVISGEVSVRPRP